jgi:hypothetical protein
MSKDPVQQFALARAKELVSEDPGAAFDLILAADKAAAKDPRVITLNRAMRTVKTEAIKYLNRKLPGLIWSAGDTHEYLSHGSQFMLFGSAEANGPSSGRISVEITAEGDDAYNVRTTSYGKGGRGLTGDYVRNTTLDIVKKKPDQWLSKAAGSLKSNLEGSLEEEKGTLLEYTDAGIKDLEADLQAAKDFRAKVEKSKNLIADVDDLRRAAPTVSDPFYGVRRLLDDLKRAGG